MFRNVGLYASLLLGSLLLVSCQPLSENAQTLKKSLLAKGCTAPCWIGIQPGVTDTEKAQEILNEHYGQDKVLNKGSLEWSGIGKDNVKAGYLFPYDEVVQEMYILFNSPIRVDELIAILGKPTHVQVTGVNMCLGVNLRFKDDGMLALLGNLDGTYKGVNESQSVWGILLRTVEVEQNAQVYDAALIEWDGYKDYCEIVFGD